MRVLLCLIFFPVALLSFSQVTTRFETVFQPETRTYNGSDNPAECWESVDHGLVIQTENFSGFFLLPVREYEALKNQLLHEQIVVEVVFFEEPAEGSGAQGSVVKITYKGAVIFNLMP